MKWEMEVDEIEAVLEKIWDLHDKLSDAIHSISRAHFLNSIKNPAQKLDEFYNHRKKKTGDDETEKRSGPGFVFVKEFRVDENDSAVQEAKSLYAIRTALEHLEDQLEFFHTVQAQQRAERDAAISRLEQSRIILAMRLAEHQGKKYKVIEEAQALVSDVRDASRFVAPNHVYSSTPYPSGERFVQEKSKRPNALVNFFLSSFTFITKPFKLDHTVGIVGNSVLLAISMLAFVHLNQSGSKVNYTVDQETRRNSYSHDNHLAHLDVMLARG